MFKKSYIYLFLGLFLLATSYVAALEQPYIPSGKVFLTFNWDLSLKGNGFGSKASVIDPSSDEEKLDGEGGFGFYSYNSFFLKSGYMFTDDIGSYINIGLSERAFLLDYSNFAVYPSIENTTYFYQQYYHLEAGCRINAHSDVYIDFGAYYGIQKGDMTAIIKDERDFLWTKAKEGNMTVKEDSDTKINNDFGITVALGMLYPIVQDSIYFDVSMRFINGVYPAFKQDGDNSGDWEWKLYNCSLGLVLGITAAF